MNLNYSFFYLFQNFYKKTEIEQKEIQFSGLQYKNGFDLIVGTHNEVTNGNPCKLLLLENVNLNIGDKFYSNENIYKIQQQQNGLYSFHNCGMGHNNKLFLHLDMKKRCEEVLGYFTKYEYSSVLGGSEFEVTFKTLDDMKKILLNCDVLFLFA